MKGYFARVTGCCGTTSVDLGLYSSIDMLVCANVANGTTMSRDLNMNGLFLLQCKNLMPQLGGKSHAIAGRSLIGRDRIANAHGHVACLDVSGSERQLLAVPGYGRRASDAIQEKVFETSRAWRETGIAQGCWQGTRACPCSSDDS